MQFSSSVFLILFLPAVMILYKIGRSLSYKNMVLLLASLLFYAWGEPEFVFVLAGGIFFNYLAGIFIEKSAPSGKKYLLIASVVFNLGILVVYKYLTFILQNVSLFLVVEIPNIHLPIGISFYTFQIMSYIFDVYYGRAKAQKNILNLALYISMFPQLVAGPIVRYNAVESEIRNRTETAEDFSEGVSRFIRGLAKKILIADFLGGIADKIFMTAQYSDIAVLTAWCGALAYTFEIYYDFSGYSDMAIGLGRCFGFHFQENFNYPYISRSITEFWKRWHISLTDWFRDYVYIPLGGNRVSKTRHIWNLFIVWLLTGIWHGAEWTFLLWGMIYFFLQLFEKKTNITQKLPAIPGYLLTMFLVTIGWVLFRATDITTAFRFIGNLFHSAKGWYDTTSLQYVKSGAVVFILAYIGSFPCFRALKERLLSSGRGALLYAVFDCLISISLLVISLLVVINGLYSPFIYFNF